jgi:DHA1 family bicyclomycin/chloramphenicol resistance-like MFS transporter
VFIGGCAMAGFCLSGGLAFVLINYYGLSSTQYSMAFALNSIAFIGAAQLTGRLVSALAWSMWSRPRLLLRA